jgi:hypothetical protein
VYSSSSINAMEIRARNYSNVPNEGDRMRENSQDAMEIRTRNYSNTLLEGNRVREDALLKHIAHLKEKIQSQQLDLEKKQKIAKSLLKRIKVLECTSLNQTPPGSNLSSEDEKIPLFDEPLTGHTSSSQARILEKNLSSITTDIIRENELVSNLINHIYFLETNAALNHNDSETHSTSAIKKKKNPEDDDARTTRSSTSNGGEIIGMLITVEKKRSSSFRSRKKAILLEAISEVIDEANASLGVASTINPKIDTHDFPHSSTQTKTKTLSVNGNGSPSGPKTLICSSVLDMRMLNYFSCLNYCRQ